MRKQIPLALPFQDWPGADRDAWNDLFTPRDFFAETTPAFEWSTGTQKLRKQGYAQWLSFLMREDQDAFALPFEQRVTKSRVRAFIKDCENRSNKPISIHGHLISLYSVLRCLAPAQSWSWLCEVANRYKDANLTACLAPPPPVSAGRVFKTAYRLLKAFDPTTPPTLREAVAYRNALMMGLLIARPVRRRALCAMTTTGHLRPQGDGIDMVFSKEDMKDHKARTFALPDALFAPMNIYLASVRPVLLRDQTSDALWLTIKGTGLTDDGCADAIERFTLSHLGHTLNPHKFRHIAATSIATFDPAHVNIIRDLLGHATLAMSEKHYNRASSTSSFDTRQSMVDGMLKNAPKSKRVKLPPRT